MVSIRFSSFLFVLMFILQNSAADIHQVTEKIEVTAGNGFGGRSTFSAIRKDIMGDVPTPREARNGKIGGRKMMKRRVLLKEMAKAKETANEGASKISGATHSVGNCSHKGKRKMNIECRSTHPHMKRFKMSSFVALNADYHPQILTHLYITEEILLGNMDMNISKKPLGYPQEHIPQETNKRMVTKISFNSARLKNLPNTNQIYSQHSKGDSIRFSLECSSRLKNLAPKVNDESRKLVEATNEIAHLMSKDYVSPSRRKPPIHN